MKIITISSSYSSLGKTTLARALRSTLGNESTVILKIGHGENKGKPEQLFHDIPPVLKQIELLKAEKIPFVIIESNRITEHITPDLALFIEGTNEPPKTSALLARSKADIIISRALSEQAIGQILVEKQFVNSQLLTALTQTLSGFLYDYKLRTLQIKIKLWIEIEGQPVFGHGKYTLLKKIEELRSLNKAAQELGMSYRHAWAYIKSMENRLGEKILEQTKSGNKKAGSQLSLFAKKLLTKYEELEKKMLELC